VLRSTKKVVSNMPFYCALDYPLMLSPSVRNFQHQINQRNKAIFLHPKSIKRCVAFNAELNHQQLPYRNQVCNAIKHDNGCTVHYFSKMRVVL
jgi:hypothetical protein